MSASVEVGVAVGVVVQSESPGAVVGWKHERHRVVGVLGVSSGAFSVLKPRALQDGAWVSLLSPVTVQLWAMPDLNARGWACFVPEAGMARLDRIGCRQPPQMILMTLEVGIVGDDVTAVCSRSPMPAVPIEVFQWICCLWWHLSHSACGCRARMKASVVWKDDQ